ncbi:hypothetical protein B0H17DRAFT_265530 [Mycena rosella]|uniref:Uncharacterized protein n=1 Tax=Mycena rosella TaxID=1033263 RepID=A0AAD7G4E8_MYCRO|nr:hypothetical protein B0H17DRAFT_265530 [Mycena rosella]
MSSLADYEQIASGRAKLQVWSDIPASGRSSGDWGEADFTAPAHSNSPSENAFSLLLDKQRDEIGTSLTLDFWVPLFAERFSFTYRMVYPTGEIKWLGHYGHNGTLVLDRTDSDPVLLSGGWLMAEDGSSRRDWVNGRAVYDLEVAQLSRPADYTAYDVPENSFMYPKDATLVVLLPRLSHPVISPPTLIFGSTPSGSISFTSGGAVTMSGTGSLLFVACESVEEVESAVSRVVNHSSSPRVRAVSYTHGVAVLASGPDKNPVEVAVIPMASSKLLIHSSLTLRSLACLSSGGSHFCVYSSMHSNARFFSRELAEASDESISISVGQSGGQFIVTPVETVTHREEQWQVAIASAYTAASFPAPSEALPTPPPSPRLRPLPHRLSETVSQSPDPSFLSLPAPISSDDNRSASDSSTHLVLHSASQRRAGVLAVVRHVFFVLFAWFARLFRRNPAVPPKRITDERTPLLQPEAVYPQPRVEVSTPTQEDFEHGPQPPVTSSSSGVFAEVGGGKSTMLFQAAQPTSLFDVPIQLNGQDVDLDVQRNSDGVFIVSFSSAAGGRLKIG